MNRVLLFVFLATLSSAFSQGPKQDRLEIELDRPEAIYEVGETARFSISIPEGAGTVHWVLSRDGYGEIERGTSEITTGDPVARIEATLEKPGFLMCRARTGTIKGIANAAFSPLEITPSHNVPEDFDEFWRSQFEQLAEVPVTFQLRRQELGPDLAGIDLFDLAVSTGEGKSPTSGYYARPREVKEGSSPAVLWVHGAGVRSAIKNTALAGAKDGYLSLDLNAHGLPNGRGDDYYKAIAAGRLKDYPKMGRENRDGVYFREMILRLIRAIDFLTAQPEWDGKNVSVVGHSQGGYQAIAAGGLDPRVSFIAAGVPAGCDHTGMLRKRISGWPKFVPLLPDGSGKPDPVVAEVSRYYDGVNFASRCEVPAILSVGLVDTTCPPTSVYAAYNQLNGEKEMIVRPEMAHAAPTEISTAFWEAVVANRR